MQLSEAIECYAIAALAAENSQLTITTYRSALGTMLEFLGDKEVANITTNDLRSELRFNTQELAWPDLNA